MSFKFEPFDKLRITSIEIGHLSKFDALHRWPISQRYLSCDGVNLSIGSNLKLAPVP